jgi:cell division protein FtsX
VGATRSRLIRQLLTETALLAALGGAAGVVLAVWIADALAGLFSDPRTPFVLYSALNWRILAFAAAMSTATGLLFGLSPALRASGSEPTAGLRPGRTAGALAAVQIALSLVLLVCAGLFAGTLRNLRNIDPGFNRERVLLVDVTPGERARLQGPAPAHVFRQPRGACPLASGRHVCESLAHHTALRRFAHQHRGR